MKSALDRDFQAVGGDRMSEDLKQIGEHQVLGIPGQATCVPSIAPLIRDSGVNWSSNSSLKASPEGQK